MAFDIKAKIEEITEKIKKDPKLMEEFTKDPVKTLEGIIGVDLPDDQVKAIADGVKAKVSIDQISGALGGLGGLFKK